jgi:glycosyltransferase involved in cell wall biosynthesis
VALTRTSLRGPSTRYRVGQYRALLAEQGLQVELQPLFGDGWFAILERRRGPVRTLLKGGYSLMRLMARCAQAWRAARSAPDLVLIEQQLFPYLPWTLEQLLWPRSVPTLLEFDDAIWLTFAHERKLARACARADLVVVGNEFLAAFARRHSDRVRVIPTTVDVDRQAPNPRERNGTLRVGWIGLRYNLPYLRMLAEPLAALAREGLDCELRVISSAAPEPGPVWTGVKVVHRAWSQQTEAEEIADCDVGVMPLPDDDWARGKCGLKLLQFMAAGLPVVASPIGLNRELLRDGENGLLAEDARGWADALRRLHRDPLLARRLGAAGRETVREGYSLTRGAALVADAYRQARAHR